jgi:hypothetical protein
MSGNAPLLIADQPAIDKRFYVRDEYSATMAVGR